MIFGIKTSKQTKTLVVGAKEIKDKNTVIRGRNPNKILVQLNIYNL